MNIAKSIAWTMTILALTVLVAACGGDTPPEPDAPPETIDVPEVVVPAPTSEPEQVSVDEIPPEMAERLAEEARIQMETQRDQLGAILKQYEPIVAQGFNELEKQAAALSEEGLKAYEPAREKLLEEMDRFRAVAEKINDPTIESGNELLDELKQTVKDFRAALRDALAVLESEAATVEDGDESADETVEEEAAEETVEEPTEETGDEEAEAEAGTE
jgi:hypothetical protein